jgi:RNA polymerase sigma factor (sigma-70 family)
MKNYTQSQVLTDEQLVCLYLNGNTSCLEYLYQRYFNKVYRKCYGYTRNHNEAFDIAQDVLIKSFAKLATFKGNSKFSTWLFSITANYCVEVLRKNKHIAFEKIDDQFILTDISDDNSSELFDYYLPELINVLKEIPEIDQAMLRMKYEQNYSIKDLQDSFNLSASAVKMRLQRARHRIEKICLSRLKAIA